MNSIIYKAAKKTDVAAIVAIHVASWRDAYRSILEPEFLAGPVEEEHLALWSKRLAEPPPTLFVETAHSPDQRLLGFISTYRDHDQKWGSLVDNLHVLPEMRGQKIGEALLRSAARQLEAQEAQNGLHLWVFENNQAGLRFYQRLGGQVVERDTSRIPAANGKAILRVHWPALSALL